MKTMWHALKLCLPVTIMTFAIFTRSNLVVNPGWRMIVDMLTVAISCWGFTLSMFGRIVRNRGSDMMVRVALALVSMVVMFHPNDTLALWTGVVLLPAVIYCTHRHQTVGRPKSGGLQEQPIG